MKASNLKKDKNKSIRINGEVLEQIELSYGSIQKFLDAKLDDLFSVSINDNLLVYEEGAEQ